MNNFTPTFHDTPLCLVTRNVQNMHIAIALLAFKCAGNRSDLSCWL